MFEKIIRDLKEEFSQFEIYYRIEDYHGKFHIFFIKPVEVKDLDERWKNLSSWIAGNFQTQLKMPFEVWNLYVFFLVGDDIDKQLKYKIENDTFSSRKIVIEDTRSQDEIIKEYITNTDLQMVPEKRFSSEQLELVKNPDLERLLDGRTLRGKRNTKEAPDVFNKLFDLLKSRDDKI